MAAKNDHMNVLDCLIQHIDDADIDISAVLQVSYHEMRLKLI